MFESLLPFHFFNNVLLVHFIQQTPPSPRRAFLGRTARIPAETFAYTATFNLIASLGA